MKTFAKYIRPKLPVMSVQLFIKFFGTVIELLLPWMLSNILDDAVPAGDVPAVWLWGLLMVGCAGAALVANVVANRMSTRISRDITRRLRRDLFARVLTLSSAQEDSFTTPSLISRLTSDTYNTHQMIDRMQRLGVRAPILLIGGIALCLMMEPVLTLVLAAVLPLLALVVWKVSGNGVRLYSNTQTALDTLVRRAQESMTGIRVIQALSRGPYERQRFGQANDAVVQNEQKASMLMNLTGPVMNLLLNTGLTLVIVVGAIRVNAGLTTSGTIIAFLSYFTIILNALMMVSRIFVMYSKGAASARRIAAVLDTPHDGTLSIPAARTLYAEAGGELYTLVDDTPAAQDKTVPAAEGAAPDAAAAANTVEGAADAAAGAGTADAAFAEKDAAAAPGVDGPCPAGQSAPCIVFDDVTFSYGGVRDTVQHIDFSLAAGQTLGILGPTGSGKSTVLKLLLGFYKPQAGEVRLWGAPVTAYPPAVLYSQFGVVFQNDFLYAGTLAEAIDFGRDLEKERLLAGAAAAQADFIFEREAGLDGELAVRGSNLSGGQKQRLLLARALAAAPPILLLDDSSSALDYKTDAALRRALARDFADTTKVIVAQRVSALQQADLILVLDDGVIIGRGTHEELLQSCEAYREIAQLQMGEDAPQQDGAPNTAAKEEHAHA